MHQESILPRPASSLSRLKGIYEVADMAARRGAAERAEAMSRVGRNAAPMLLWDWWSCGAIDAKELTSLIADAWMAAEWPVSSIGERAWIEMFKVACSASGGIHLGLPAKRLTTPSRSTRTMTVYRGSSTKSGGRGMSWTLDAQKAKWFAVRRCSFVHEPCGLYRAVVPLTAVLAMLGGPEREVVVNPNQLRNRVEMVETV